MQSDTLVFIPAWNEEDNLPAVLDELHAGLPESAVLVVDDGSTDSTADVARANGADVVSFGENRGLQEGIAAGYAYADSHGYEYVGRVDADGQHPVDELARLLEIVRDGRADVAVGSRFATGDGYEEYRYEPSASRQARHVSAPPCDAGRPRTTVSRRDERHVRGQQAGHARSRHQILERRARGRVAASAARSRAARRRDPGPHARPSERRVEAARRQGRAARRSRSSGTLLLYGVWRRLRRPR